MKKCHNDLKFYFFLFIFVGFVFIALGANLLNIDKQPGWGFPRKVLFGVGSGGLVATLGFKGILEIEKSILKRRAVSSVKTDPRSDSPSGKSKWITTFAILGFLIAVIALYVGFVSVWNWADWPAASTHYYGMLGEAFLQGKTYLPIEPSPLLADLQDPYSLSKRAGIPIKTDLSYFKNRYYMYWGPAPAGFAAIWILLSGQTPGDERIVFFAISLAFVFLFLIIRQLKNHYFSAIPGWLFATGCILVATFHPLLWMLNSPDIYVAAIASGQAFLLGGLFFALPALDGARFQGWSLALAGVFWILAIGSRLVLILPVGILCIAILIRLFQQTRIENLKKVACHLIAFLLPMVIGMLLLGYYNYVRFGNFLETGLQYSLNPHELASNGAQGLIFNPRYLLPNLVYYVATPLRYFSKFPFIKPYWGPVEKFTSILKGIDIPDLYLVENCAGLLYTVPTLIFAIILLVRLFKNLRSGVNSQEPPEITIQARFTLGSILLAGLAATLPILTYFFVSIRYLFDFVPMLMIGAVAGIWHEYLHFSRFPIRRWLVIFLILFLVVIATIVSFLLAMTGSKSRFDDCNPALFNTLVQFFQKAVE